LSSWPHSAVLRLESPFDWAHLKNSIARGAATGAPAESDENLPPCKEARTLPLGGGQSPHGYGCDGRGERWLE
jgi:hypothetical protein